MDEISKRIEAFASAEAHALRGHREAGGRVAASFCRLFPASVVAGAGYWPVRVLKGATVAAESAAERIVRPDTCPYCKSILGNFLEKTSLHAEADAIVGLMTCDQMRRTVERLSADLGLPVFPVQMPATCTPEAEDYYAQGVAGAAAQLAAHAGTEFDAYAAAGFETERASAASKLRGIIVESLAGPLAVHRLCSLFAWARPGAFSEFLDVLLPELDGRRPGVEVIVVGGCTCEEDDAVVCAVDDFKAGMIPLTCTGLNMLEDSCMDPDPGDGFIDAAARAAFRSPACIRRRPNSEVYERIGGILKERRAAGIILKTLPFCDLWFTEKERMKRTFGVPVLAVETGFGEGIRNGISVRIEAFLETLA